MYALIYLVQTIDCMGGCLALCFVPASQKKLLKVLTGYIRHDIVNLVDREEYPSPAEGIGLENRQGCQSPQGFESPFLLHYTKYNSHI